MTPFPIHNPQSRRNPTNPIKRGKKLTSARRKAAEARHDEGPGDADGGAGGPPGPGPAAQPQSPDDPPGEDGVAGRPDERAADGPAQAHQELLRGGPAGHAARGRARGHQGGARARPRAPAAHPERGAAEVAVHGRHAPEVARRRHGDQRGGARSAGGWRRV